MDGDKRHLAQSEKVKKQLPGVPIVHLDEGEEIEDLVPRATYFAALAELTSQDPSEMTDVRFEEWAAPKGFKKTLLFSKRVDLWLSEEYPDVAYSKPAVMRRCASTVPLAKLRTEKLRDLVAAIAARFVVREPIAGTPPVRGK